MANFVIFRLPFIILVTDFTTPDNLINGLLILNPLIQSIKSICDPNSPKLDRPR